MDEEIAVIMSESQNNDLVRVSDVVALLQFERAKWGTTSDDLASICATGALANCLCVMLGLPIAGYPRVEVVKHS